MGWDAAQLGVFAKQTLACCLTFRDVKPGVVVQTCDLCDPSTKMVNTEVRKSASATSQVQ